MSMRGSEEKECSATIISVKANVSQELMTALEKKRMAILRNIAIRVTKNGQSDDGVGRPSSLCLNGAG